MRGASPNWTSVTGASIPAATHEAPSRPGAGATRVTCMARPGQSPRAREADDPAPDDEHALRHGPSRLSPLTEPYEEEVV